MRTVLFVIGVLCAFAAPAWGGQTEYVFLVTGDGIRHQELFTGADGDLLKEENKKSSGIQSLDEIRTEFWDEDPLKRRERAMPFFWGELSKQGIILGNRALGSKVNLANPHKFSYPGYAEILNGQHLQEVKSNDPNWSPRQTVLEYVRQKLRLDSAQVAAFGSWKIFNWIVMQSEGSIFCNAGYERMSDKYLTSRGRIFDQIQFDMLSPWDSVRHDVPTLELALDYITEQKPKFLYLALGETDDWAHDRRYDRTLQTLRYFDDALRRLWTTLQENRRYRGKSTLIVTTDHGRGRTLEDWTSHGARIEGAEEVWIAIFGPDTPKRGELRDTREYSSSNIAATVLKFYNLDPKEFNASAAPPIAEAFGMR